MGADDYFNTSELAGLFAAVEGEAHSDGGLVTVRIDSKGCVREIVLDPKLSGVSAETLAEAITAVCGKAFDNRIDRLADVVDDYQRRHGLPPEVLSFLHNSVASLRPATATIEADDIDDQDDEGGPVLKSIRLG
jgi:hypothetical protein